MGRRSKGIVYFVFKLMMVLTKGAGRLFDLLPQNKWMCLSFIGTVAVLMQFDFTAELLGSAPPLKSGLLLFSFCYCLNYFVKLFTRQSSYYKTDGKTFYNSNRWQTVRYKFLKTAEKKCVLCGSDRGPFHVDHIKPRSKYPALSLDINNLQLLCKPCNLGKGVDDVGNTDFRKKRA